MKNFNNLHAQVLVQRQAKDIKALDAVIGAVKCMSAETANVVFGDNYALRSHALDARITPYNVRDLYDSVAHATWTQFLREYNVYSYLDTQEYTAAAKELTFSDAHRRRHYEGVKQLRPFTKAAALQFYQDHLEYTYTKQARVFKRFLSSCGTSYKTNVQKFSVKMTLRGVDVYGHGSHAILNLVDMLCMYANVEFCHDKFFLEWRNNRSDDQFQLVDGLDLTLEKHQNGNHTMRMSKELVTLLNTKLDMIRSEVN